FDLSRILGLLFAVKNIAACAVVHWASGYFDAFFQRRHLSGEQRVDSRLRAAQSEEARLQRIQWLFTYKWAPSLG
ncbi:MAG: hypothetical protein WB542_14775, partial [Polaromonas sp.]